MAETANIMAMAEKLSTELFGEFLWSQTGPANVDWPCERHESHKATTHPTDVVFYYDEPYRPRRTYLQSDLKSYARGSITPYALRTAIKSLARQVACAEISAEWRRLYVHSDVNFDVCGLLLVYNHDGEYDRDFSAALERPSTSIFRLGHGSTY